jgi:anaerobic magnesium-protoporphyrin IX monomethyl ester cyclase
MMEKVLLISFQEDTDVIGLKYIHSYLSGNGFDSNLLFLPSFHSTDFASIGIFLKDFSPKVIGITLMSPEYEVAREFSQILKEKFPDIILVWGGIHPSINPVECLNYADCIILGEGEEAFLELVSAIAEKKSLGTIKNLAFHDSEGIHVNQVRPANTQLDVLPFPEHMPQKSYILQKGKIVKLNQHIFKKIARMSGKIYSLISSRGCPFSCTYCCNSFYSKLYGKNVVRKRSVGNIIAELKNAVTLFPDIFFINIQDDNFFSYDIEWMKEFSVQYKSEIKKNFFCRTTPVHLKEEKIQTLKDAGLSWIYMGLQSGSPNVNRNIYKRFVPNEKFLEGTKVLKKYNISCQYDVILDNPYETDEDVIDTINVLLQIPKPFILQLFSLCFYQGTELHERAVKDKIKFSDPMTKNFLVYKPTYLNKIIRLIPLLPASFIRFMVTNRNSPFAEKLLNIVYFCALILFEPLLWFRLFLRSINYDLFGAIRVLMTFSKVGFNRLITKGRVTKVA